MTDNEDTLKIAWYGRCCFLVEFQEKKILFDPYDAYCNVEIGRIETDILISSSTWHDHGHIGASPKAHIYTYPGEYENSGIKIVGIEALEERGSPTVVFNIKLGPFLITNFADFGCERKAQFTQSLTNPQFQALKSTNIAFTRASIQGPPDGKHTHIECLFDFCSPAIIFPEHYFPLSFTREQIPAEIKDKFFKPVEIVEGMIKKLGYPVKEIEGYQIEITPDDLKLKKLVRFLKLHPQVKYQTSLSMRNKR